MSGRQIAFEIASRITAAVGIMISIVRQLTVFTQVTTGRLRQRYPRSANR